MADERRLDGFQDFQTVDALTAYRAQVSRFPALGGGLLQTAFQKLRGNQTLGDLMSDPAFAGAVVGEEADKFVNAFAEAKDLHDFVFNCTQWIVLREISKYPPERRMQLAQEAAIKLRRAIEIHDPTRGSPEAYLSVSLRQSLRGVGDESKAIRINPAMYRKIRATRRLEAELVERLGRQATQDELRAEVAEKLGFPDRTISTILNTFSSGVMSVRSLDAALRPDEEEGFSLLDAVSDARVDVAAEAERSVLLEELLKGITEDERALLEMRYVQEKSLAEIGRSMNMTVSETRGQIGRLLRNLKHTARGEERESTKEEILFSEVVSKLDELDSDVAEILRLRFIERKSYQEIRALTYYRTPEGIRMLVRRALANLKESMVTGEPVKQLKTTYKLKRNDKSSQPDWSVRYNDDLPTPFEWDLVSKEQPSLLEKAETGASGTVLPPLLQDLVDRASEALTHGRAYFKQVFPNSFFPDEIMTDQEKIVFNGRRQLVDDTKFPLLCGLWGVTLEEGERIYKAAEMKYYSFALD